MRVTMYVPYLAHYSDPGSTIGMTYLATNAQGKTVAVGQPTATLAPDQSVTFTPGVHPGEGPDLHRRRDAERGQRAQPVTHGVHHGRLSS